jgi:hypothetical protein
MAYTNFSFPPSTPLFPRASLVEEYLEAYAQHFALTPYIRLSTSVTSTGYDTSSSQWRVELSTPETLYFDHLIVCNGHYRVPRYPNTPGIQDWLSSKKATHSAWYRSPDHWKPTDTILVVGAGPSGQDITSDMSKVVQSVIHSVTGAVPSNDGNVKLRGRIQRFGPASGGVVEFEDGTTESGIDHCILATGYEMTFPFISKEVIQESKPFIPTVNSPIPPPQLLNSTYHLYPLARHLFAIHEHIPPSALAFPGLLVRVAPFPLVEAQAAAIVHAIAHPSSINISDELASVHERNDLLYKIYGDNPLQISKAWHRFELHEQFDYRDALYAFAKRSVRVQDWEREMYNQKLVLRKLWVQLENEGKAEEFVKGVGEGGIQEWVELMRRMLEMAEQVGIKVQQEEVKAEI